MEEAQQQIDDATPQPKNEHIEMITQQSTQDPIKPPTMTSSKPTRVTNHRSDKHGKVWYTIQCMDSTYGRKVTSGEIPKRLIDNYYKTLQDLERPQPKLKRRERPQKSSS